MKKYLFLFISSTAVFFVVLWWILSKGQGLETIRGLATPEGNLLIPEVQDTGTRLMAYFHEFFMNFRQPMGILILQIVVILFTARIFGFLFRLMRQPSVIGEIVAGIILGPSVMGWLFPQASEFLFPLKSLGNLQFISQIGLVFFMFIIGMELDFRVIRTKVRDAFLISQVGTLFPFLLGTGLSYFIYNRMVPGEISFTSFALFMGTAMSITAFPVLARIIHERNLTKSYLGSMALASAAIGDISAWCILAVVIAVVKAGTVAGAVPTILLAVLFILFMIGAVKPFLKRIGSIYVSPENMNKTVVAFVFFLMLGSAYLSEVIGIHPLFGAFLAGTIMPHDPVFKKTFSEKVEDVSMVVFLPLFFALTGLKTRIGLITDSYTLVVCLILILVAFLGKLGGVTLTAKYTGQNWKNSLSLGTLMNTRGLMELVVLDIGYNLGILPPVVFAMMVLMALATTFFTGPALQFIDKVFGTEKREISFSKESLYNVLISFGRPKMGSSLLMIANLLTGREKPSARITALHITPNLELKTRDPLLFETESFKPIRETAEKLGVEIETIYRIAPEITREIKNTAKKGDFGLLLLGSGKPLFAENLIGGKIRPLLEHNPYDVAVLSDHNLQKINKILLLLNNQPSDKMLIDYGVRMSHDPEVTMSLLNTHHELDVNILKPLIDGNPLSNFEILSPIRLRKDLLFQYSLIILSHDYWKELVDTKAPWIRDCPSLLILKAKV